MGKILSLIKNEVIKQYKKTSIKVFLLIIIAVSFGASFFLKYVNGKGNEINWMAQNCQQEIVYLQSQIESLDKNAKNYEIAKEIFKCNIDVNQTLIDNKVTWDDWRTSPIYSNNENKKTAVIIKGILEGIGESDLLNGIYDFDNSMVSSYYGMDKEELQKELNKVNDKISQNEKIIKENDYLEYVKENIAASEEEIADMTKELEELKKNTTADKEVVEKQIKSLQNTIDCREELLALEKYRYKNKIMFDNNDWKHRTINDINEAVNIKYEELLTEEAFKQSFSYEIMTRGYTYEQYKESFDKKKAAAEETLKVDWYSLENNIPIVEFSNDARNDLNSTYTYFMSLAIILSIIVGGSIVSNEYSTGTIRLLMIRPVSRWKIVISKFITVLLFGYAAVFVSFISNIISSGIVYRFSDYAVPVLAIKNGDVVCQNFIGSVFIKLMFISISLIFIAAVVFALSTVLKNTAVAVAFTMAGFLGSMTAVVIAAQLGMKWVGKTILPYVNLSSYVNGSYMVKSLKDFGMELDPNFGAVRLLVIAVVLTIISIIVFSKRDVTN